MLTLLGLLVFQRALKISLSNGEEGERWVERDLIENLPNEFNDRAHLSSNYVTLLKERSSKDWKFGISSSFSSLWNTIDQEFVAMSQWDATEPLGSKAILNSFRY